MTIYNLNGESTTPLRNKGKVNLSILKLTSEAE
jgi:hypothetical protein